MIGLLCGLLFAQTGMIHSLNVGEVSPKMDGRTDLEKYYSGCRLLENMYCKPHGGVAKRPGTYYISVIPESYTFEEPSEGIEGEAFRSEAYFALAGSYVFWFDPNWTYLYYTTVPDGGDLCTTAAQTADGTTTIIGYGDIGGESAIAVIDVNLAVNEDYYVRTGGWSNNEIVGALALNADETYLYALSSKWRVTKFDTSDGSQVWAKSPLWTYLGGWGMCLDADENIYVYNSGSWYVRKYDSDGNYLAQSSAAVGSCREMHYDPDTDHILCAGPVISGYVMTVCDTDLNILYRYADATAYGRDIIISGDYYYLFKSAGSDGYHVVKTDTELNVIKRITLPQIPTAACLDWDGHIAVSHLSVNDSSIMILDTDLNLLDTKYCPLGISDYDGDLGRIKYTTGEVRAIPGSIATNDFGLRNPVRLITFERSTEQSYIVEMGNEYLAFYK